MEIVKIVNIPQCIDFYRNNILSDEIMQKIETKEELKEYVNIHVHNLKKISDLFFNGCDYIEFLISGDEIDLYDYEINGNYNLFMVDNDGYII